VVSIREGQVVQIQVQVLQAQIGDRALCQVATDVGVTTFLQGESPLRVNKLF